MTMTIAVYRVDSEGHRQETQPEHTVTPIKEPERTARWPKCQCPVHRAA